MSGPVDARGLLCPLPVIRLAAAARAAGEGATVTVLWTDPAAGLDIPAWARMRGHTVVGTVPHDEPGPPPGGAGLRPAFATTVLLGGGGATTGTG